jgi:hypothetical protein
MLHTQNRPRQSDDAVSAIDLRRRRHLCLIAHLSLLTERVSGKLVSSSSRLLRSDLPCLMPLVFIYVAQVLFTMDGPTNTDTKDISKSLCWSMRLSVQLATSTESIDSCEYRPDRRPGFLVAFEPTRAFYMLFTGHRTMIYAEVSSLILLLLCIDTACYSSPGIATCSLHSAR